MRAPALLVAAAAAAAAPSVEDVTRAQLPSGAWPDGETATALLALIGAGWGELPEVEKGLAYLSALEEPGAQEALALCEGYLATRNAMWLRPAQDAITAVTMRQREDGSFGDATETAWSALALAAAQQAHLIVEPAALGSLWVWTSTADPSAQALAAGHVVGVEVAAPEIPETQPEMFFATVALHARGGVEWRRWSERLADRILEKPACSLLDLLCLQVYYRYDEVFGRVHRRDAEKTVVESRDVLSILSGSIAFVRVVALAVLAGCVSPAVDGDFRLAKDAYAVGEPIVVEFTATNHGRSAFTFWEGGDYRFAGRHERYSFRVVDAAGRDFTTTAPSHLGGAMTEVSLKPGARFRSWQLLNAYFHMLPPGRRSSSIRPIARISARSSGSRRWTTCRRLGTTGTSSRTR